MAPVHPSDALAEAVDTLGLSRDAGFADMRNAYRGLMKDITQTVAGLREG